MANDIISQASSILSKVAPYNPGSIAPPKPKQKHCLNCLKELVGPSYKKFCDARCHDAFNNKKKAEKRKEWKKINGPMEQNDKFLARLYQAEPKKEWSMELLSSPFFNGEAYFIRIKDDRLPEEGKRFIKYSLHEVPGKKTFKVLYHG